MFDNIPPPHGMPELVAILAIVRDAHKLAEAVQQIEDARERANATRKQASEEVEAAMTEAAMVRREAEQARDEMLTAAIVEARRIHDDAKAAADAKGMEMMASSQALERRRAEVNERAVALEAREMDLAAKEATAEERFAAASKALLEANALRDKLDRAVAAVA